MDLITEKDKRDLEFIAKLDPEFVALSFVGNGKDVQKAREIISQFGNKRMKLISKVERPVALKNIKEIIAASDGIMVARGDLGVECDPWFFIYFTLLIFLGSLLCFWLVKGCSKGTERDHPTLQCSFKASHRCDSNARK